jgi:hypothetical protein
MCWTHQDDICPVVNLHMEVLRMSLPNPKVILALIEKYKKDRKERWASYKETAAYLLSFLTWSYQGPAQRITACDRFEKAVKEISNSDLEKWAELCIDLGNEATIAAKHNKESLFAKYCNAMRTYILSQLNKDENVRKQFQILIDAKKSAPLSKDNDKKPTEAEFKKLAENRLLELSYLGDVASINDALNKNLLAHFVNGTLEPNTLPLQLQAAYFNSQSFYNDAIKTDSKLASFAELESNHTPVAVSEVKQEAVTISVVVSEAKTPEADKSSQSVIEEPAAVTPDKAPQSIQATTAPQETKQLSTALIADALSPPERVSPSFADLVRSEPDLNTKIKETTARQRADRDMRLKTARDESSGESRINRTVILSTPPTSRHSHHSHHSHRKFKGKHKQKAGEFNKNTHPETGALDHRAAMNKR